MKKLILAITVLMVSFTFLSADIYIKQETKTGAFMGQPEKNITQEQWFGKNKIATISEEASYIVNPEEKKISIIRHPQKKYFAMDLPFDIGKILPEQAAPMYKAAMDSMTVTVAANGQTKTIGKWNSKGYDITISVMGMEVKIIMWASTEVPFDYKSFSSLYSEMMKAQFSMGEKFIEEFKKIDGYPVSTELTQMGMMVNSNVTEISEKPAPADVYKVPAGYTLQEKLTAEDMGQK